MKFIFYVLVFVFLVGAARAEENFSNADLLRNFDAIAFGNEYTGKRYDIVRKWAKPMRMGIQGKDYPAYLETFIDDVARDLRETSGHPVELYYSYVKHKAKKARTGF